MFDEIELNPKAAILAVVGGMVAIFVMKNVEVGLIFKIGSFLLTTIACYFMVSFMANK